MRLLAITALLIGLMACDGRSPSPNQGPEDPQATSHDGRFDSECSARSGTTNKAFCRVSIYQLLANVERYDGKYVEFVGYLDSIAGVAAVYPTEESLRRLDFSSAVVIAGSADPKLNGRWVAVFGLFDAQERGRKVHMFAGTLDKAQVHPR